MKRIRAFLSLLLVLMLMAVPVSTQAREVINGGKYTDVTPPGPGNFTNYGSLVIFGTGHTFTYPYTAAAAGEYHISVRAGASSSLAFRVQVGTASVEAMIDTGSATSYKEFYIGKITLTEGENLLKINTSTGGGTIGLSEIYVEKAADRQETNFQRTEGAYRNYYLPTTLEAEDFDLGANGYYSQSTTMTSNDYREAGYIPVTEAGSGYQIALRAGEWVNYTFKVTEDGSYGLALLANSSGTLHLYFDGMENPIVAKLAGAGETEIADLYLEEGTHTLKVQSTEVKTDLDAILFTAGEDGQPPEALATELTTGTEDTEVQADELRPVWRELWVSADAPAGGSGAKDAPFHSIEAAKEAVREIRGAMEGDIVIRILPGEYELSEKLVFNEKDGGTNGWRVIYQGANALERPIISGGTHVTGWKEYEKGVWKVDLPEVEDMRQLYVNGYAAQRARSKYLYVFGTGYDNPETEYPLDGYYTSQLNFPVVSNPEDLELAFNQLWTVQRVPVKDIRDGGNLEWIVECDQPYFDNYQNNYNKDIVPLPGSKGYLENAFELLDEPGEFYFDKNTRELFYMPFPEEDLTEADTVIGRTEFMAEVMGSSKDTRITGLTFSNLDFRYGTWLDVNRTGLSTFQADCLVNEDAPPNRVQGNGITMPAVIQVRNAKDITIKNCNFQNLGASAIFMDEYVDDSKVDGNVFRDISGTAVTVGSWRLSSTENVPSDLCKNIFITNNVMKRIGLDYYGSPAIGVYYARNIISEHNHIEDTPYTGITYGWGWGSQAPIVLDSSGHSISYNRIIDNSNTVKDGGPIYTLGEMRNTYIQYNYLTDSRDFGGIYFDSGSAMMTCRYNVLEDMSQNGIFGAGSKSYGMTITENWANIPNLTRTKFDAVDSVAELPLVYEDKNWPAEALEVMENAGLERGYTRLLSGTGYPAWRTPFWEHEISVNDFYESVNIIEKHCNEWMEGGEGVAYHESRDGQEPRVYDLGMNISVGDTVDGEWIAYEIDVDREGDYQLEVQYSYLSSDKSDNMSSSAGLHFYVDDEKVIDTFMLADTGSWNAYLPMDVGEPIHLTAGRHIVKLEFENAFSLEKFRLINTDFTETEPEYDDAQLLSRKGE